MTERAALAYHRTVLFRLNLPRATSAAIIVLSTLALAFVWTSTSAAARPPRLVFFGDSLSYGLHASEPDRAFAQIVRARLARTEDHGPAFFFLQDPFGLLDDAERRLPLVVAAEPTLVFLELGHHEIWSNQAEVDRFESRYARILDRLLESGAEVIPSTLAWLGDPPGTFAYRASLQINAVIWRLAQERGLVVADLWSPTYLRGELLSTEHDSSFIEPYHGDHLHPNDAGHRVLADAFWAAYRERRRGPLPLGIVR